MNSDLYRKKFNLVSKINGGNWDFIANFPPKQRKKLEIKLREMCRTIGYHDNVQYIKCPLCINNSNIILQKRVNQHKFKFRCYNCKFSFMITINPHEILCGNCNGAGVTRNLITPAFGSKYFHNIKCKVCRGFGKLDWCSIITRAREKGTS